MDPDPQLNPLLIPDLLNHCIDYLRDSPPDLAACALVSRSWVFEAQSHLLREVRFIGGSQNQNRWARLHDVLQTSPHLVRHIQRLEFSVHSLLPETCVAICNLPFTRLEKVLVAAPFLRNVICAIQQLFSLPTLRRVEIWTPFDDPLAVSQIWDGMGPGIKHVSWGAIGSNTQPLRRSTPPIMLDSLQLVIHVEDDLPSSFYTHLESLVDLPHLRALSLGLCRFGAILLSTLAPRLLSLEVLDFVLAHSQTSFDFSHFPNLVCLRMMVWTDTVQVAGAGLLTIPSSNCLRSIIIHCHWLADEDRLLLASALSSLPQRDTCTIVLSLDADEYLRWAPDLHRLRADIMVISLVFLLLKLLSLALFPATDTPI
ncbi:hypothetical protein C8R43DRAFT_1016960 [Mycena crocata]|nr:hypothetical protein C8R43DRAFT_1016960 [Mycena crocata]